MRTGSVPLVESALRHFAAVGFEGASLQRIAVDAGLSKSSVLYHFASKDALLDAALRPAVDDLRCLLAEVPRSVDEAARSVFLARFVDYLYLHRLAVAVLINHGSSLAGHAVIDEADALVRNLSDRLGAAGSDDLDGIRFGVALAGAAFMLVAADRWAVATESEDDLRAGLTAVLADLVLGRPALPA